MGSSLDQRSPLWTGNYTLGTWPRGGQRGAVSAPICPIRRVGATWTRHAYPEPSSPLSLHPHHTLWARGTRPPRPSLSPRHHERSAVAALRPHLPPANPPPPARLPSCARRRPDGRALPFSPPLSPVVHFPPVPPPPGSHDAEADEDGGAGQPQHCRTGWAARGSSRCVRWGERAAGGVGDRGRWEGGNRLSLLCRDSEALFFQAAPPRRRPSLSVQPPLAGACACGETCRARRRTFLGGVGRCCGTLAACVADPH